MATVVEETKRGFQVNEKADVSRQYFANGFATEALAGAAVLAYLVAQLGDPPNLGGLELKNIKGDEETVGGWRCTATWGSYQKKSPKQKGESQFHFEIATQPVKVVVPIGTQTVYPDDGFAPQLINDQGIPGKAPDGVDVYEAVHSESETHYVDAAAINAAYKANVKAIVGKTNNALWKGHDPEEALLQAVSGTQRGSDDWEISFKWLVKENQSSLSIAGINVTSKPGWSFLWPHYRLNDDGTQLSNQIEHIVIAQVFRTANFGNLGIGV